MMSLTHTIGPHNGCTHGHLHDFHCLTNRTWNPEKNCCRKKKKKKRLKKVNPYWWGWFTLVPKYFQFSVLYQHLHYLSTDHAVRWEGETTADAVTKKGAGVIPRSHRCQSWLVRWNDCHNLFRPAWLLVYLFLLFSDENMLPNKLTTHSLPLLPLREIKFHLFMPICI